ncbi:MAG: AgmX/PglI C-terminal domain-containing protein [Bdellovibrionales bacterium]
MKRTLVLKNKAGQVVRTLHGASSKLHVIYRHDTGRIEVHSSLADLEQEGIEFTKLSDLTEKQMSSEKVVHLGDFGHIQSVEEVTEITHSLKPIEEEDEFKKIMKYTFLANLALLALIFSISMIRNYFQKPTEMEVVIVPVREMKERRQIVEPMKEKKPVPKNIKVAKKTKPIKKTSPSVRKSQTKPTQRVAINQMGALGVLGQLNHGPKGGLKVDSLQTSRGPGLGGGTQGSGGMQTTVYGKGLVAAALGPGARVNGAGGYGTRGKGGGKAGYGKMTLVGSSGAYFQPVEEEAVVEGGLDRDEIAAVIQRHLGEIRFCYEQGLQSRSELKGRVAVKFVIGSTGFVNTAGVNNTTLKAADVEGCIVNKLKTWKFPEPRGGVNVKVTYPFVLKRTSQG